MIKPRFQVSQAGLDLIMGFEGFRATAAELADGRWTIGYGHTKTARPGVTITEADGKILLLYDLSEINLALHDLVFTPLNQNQIDAVASFAFNIGLPAFEASTVRLRINEGALLQAACEFDLWRRAELQGEGIVVDALVRRRAAEKALFLTPLAGWAPIPTPVVRPERDADRIGQVPASEPVEVRAPLHGDQAVAEIVRPAPAVEPEAAQPVPPEPAPPEPAPIVEPQTAETVIDRLHAILSGAEPVGVALAADAALHHADPADVGHEEALEPFPLADAAPHERLIAEEPAEPPVEPLVHEPAGAEAAIAEPVAAEAAAIEHAAVETAPVEAVPAAEALDAEADEHGEAFPGFRPVPVAPEFVAGVAAAGLAAAPFLAHEAAPEPAAAETVAPVAAEPVAPEPVVAAPAPEPEAPRGWTPESFRRQALYPSLDRDLDPSASFRTPGAVRASGFHIASPLHEEKRLTPFLLLGVFGLLLFAAAAYWTVTAHVAAGAPVRFPMIAAAFAGIVCVVIAVYKAVHRFLGPDV